jgi:hypothetical protein
MDGFGGACVPVNSGVDGSDCAMDQKTGQGKPWKTDEKRNWEYGDLRLRAMEYVCAAGLSMQSISLRGHLLLDIALTQLLLITEPPGHLRRMPFWRKVEAAAKRGLISTSIKSIITDIARMRNAHAHDLETHYTFRQVHSLWVRARDAGIEHRFFSNDEDTEVTQRVTEIEELTDDLFDPAHSLTDLCIELFTHIVFWDYDSFNLVDLKRILGEAE